ncbi:MAG: FAD-dependent oxidoreductase [Desulfobacteraceae bacterium]|nr:FAD-dependent oxidoreductase [Desulfobacteraceae bacterium]
MRILIIGGSDAGISAGLRVREFDPESEVTVLIKDAYPNFSICGLPFYIGGEVEDWRSLAHRSMDQLQESGIRWMLNQTVTCINNKQKQVVAVNKANSGTAFPYDKLIIATGAASARPPIPGCDLPGVFFMRFMGDGLAVRAYLEKFRPGRATIIGSGYIGMEMAESLCRRGISVMIIEMAASVMPSVDKKFGDLLEDMLKARGIRVFTGIKISLIEKTGGHLTVYSGEETIAESEFILVAAGAKPSVELAADANIPLGKTGAIRVNEKMETHAPDIYAAGDCAQTLHRLTGEYTYMPLGTTAHKQGRIAGENAAAGNATFKGIVGTQSLKVFDLVAARTGLRDIEAKAHGFDPITIDMEAPDHKAYYPGATSMHIGLTGDRTTGRLLGAQIIGQHGAEISKRIDIIAAALYSGLTVADLVDYDLSYTPPLSSPWDPVQTAAAKWLNHCNF